MTVKEMIAIYIAEGSKWSPCYNDFAKYLFDYAMWAKMALFYDKASEAFKSETISFRGHWSPLKLMKKSFTYAEFAAVCQKNKDKIKSNPLQAIWKYKTRGIVLQVDDHYIVADSYAKKHNIT